MKKKGVGVIGYGVGAKHVETFQKHPNCEVLHICDFSDEKINEIRKRYPGIRTTKDASDILRDSDVDIISIASYDNYHYEQIINALRYGKHVFVEKPICLHEWELQNIKECWNTRPDQKLSSNLVLRTCPRFKRIRKDIRSGKIGDVFYIEADYLWGRIYKLTDGWRKDMNYYSIIHGAAIHMIDLVLWITGMRPVTVHAYGNNIATKGTKLSDNSFAAILMKFENGCIAKVTAHGGSIHPHFHRLVAFGTKKTAIQDLYGAVWLETNDPNAIPVNILEDYPAKEKRDDVINSFVDSVLDETIRPVVSSDDVFDTMSVCIAAEKSMNESC